MSDELELVQGTENPFRDVGLSEPDTKLMRLFVFFERDR